MARRLIPERTIDGWIGHELAMADPEAMIWFPTPHMQAREQPWDVSVDAFGAPGKLLVYETKGLQQGPVVSIGFDQLLALIDLWLRHPYFFYGLPGLSAKEVEKVPSTGSVGRALLRLEPAPFGEWLRVLSPIEVLGVLMTNARTRKNLHRRLEDAIGKGATEIGGVGRIPTADLVPFPSLRDHLAAARGCAYGRRIEEGDTGPAVGVLLPAYQRVQRLGAAVAPLMSELTRDELPTDALLDQLNLATDAAAGSLVPAGRTDVAQYLLTTTWVTLRMP